MRSQREQLTMFANNLKFIPLVVTAAALFARLGGAAAIDRELEPVEHLGQCGTIFGTAPCIPVDSFCCYLNPDDGICLTVAECKARKGTIFGTKI
ncbi:hypothetical protein MKEN_00429800 [Mycena kentingensis (nom. inval.)]|nr:hypothetical protein MKEN_00429800 [Mycena kentingensis (nom. inval.)]